SPAWRSPGPSTAPSSPRSVTPTGTGSPRSTILAPVAARGRGPTTTTPPPRSSVTTTGPTRTRRGGPRARCPGSPHRRFGPRWGSSSGPSAGGMAVVESRPAVIHVERDGMELRAVDSGPVDGEPVVLLHGCPQRVSSWDRVTPLLHAD